MGLVKFGNQTLNVAEIPDGHAVVSESDLNNLRLGNNEYLVLKSKMPIGVDPSQLSALVEKGQRYDTVNTDLQNVTRKSQELETKLNSVKIPEGFSEETLERVEQKDAMETRAKQIGELTNKVYADVREKYKIDPTVDPRFIVEPEGFDPAKPDALATWSKVLENAYDAQNEFKRKLMETATPASSPVGGSLQNQHQQQQQQQNSLTKGNDAVAATGVQLTHL